MLPVMLVVPGLIHLLPLSGVLGADALARLYGLDFSEPNLEILMRHRAVLFGLLGALLVAAGFRPALRTVALWAGFASVLSFLGLAWAVGDYGAAVARVVAADWIALGCLGVAAALHWGHQGGAAQRD
jgi:hypothetical protein